MPTNVFILGLDEFQRAELDTIRDAGAYRFHGLLDYDSLVEPDKIRFGELLERARAELAAFDGRIDAIIAHWDFPTSVLAPVLSHQHGLPSPRLDSVLRCEHKYWSRVEQAASVPEVVPAFCHVDPFDPTAADRIDLDYPFWLKPVKSFASQLGFRIDGPDELRSALAETRDEIPRVGAPFEEVLDLVELPIDVAGATGRTSIAEEIIRGVQAAPEGTMSGGEFNVHGIIDMHKDRTGHSFARLDYPSRLPASVRQRMTDVCERFLRHIGFDDGCFNAEFMWDEDEDRLWLVEVNTRISQSHSDLFAKVDGMSNHEVAVDVALGRRPAMPRGEGPFATATKGIIPHYEDGIVRRVPTDEDVAALCERFPHTEVRLAVEVGDRLDDLPNQDSYRYRLGTLYLGAGSHEELAECYEACLAALPFDIEPVVGA